MNFIETNNSILIASIIKNKDKWQICLRSKITDCVAKSQKNDNFTTIISIYQKVIETMMKQNHTEQELMEFVSSN